MTRRETRYWLFRFATEAEGGANAADAPEGLRESYQDQQIFTFCGGWPAFGVKWDIDDDGEVVAIEESLWTAWDKHCASVAKEMPKAVKDIIEIDRPEFVETAEVDVTVKYD